MAHDAKADPFFKIRRKDVLEVRELTFRVQVRCAIGLFYEALYGEFVVNLHYDDVVGSGVAATIHYEQVAVADAGFRHGFSAGTDDESSRMGAFQELVEVNSLFCFSFCWRREPGLNA